MTEAVEVQALRQQVDDLRAHVGELTEALVVVAGERDRLRAVLIEVVNQACVDHNGELDSCSRRDYADALRLLAELGEVEISRDVGRRVIGRWKEGSE
jgi:regulator of replication initiation timing